MIATRTCLLWVSPTTQAVTSHFATIFIMLIESVISKSGVAVDVAGRTSFARSSEDRGKRYAANFTDPGRTK